MPQVEAEVVSEAGRIAQFMGLPHWRKIDDLGLVQSVSKGFPARTASVVVQKIDPEGRFVRATDIIPKSTLHRRKDQALSRDESERLLAISRMFAEALRIYRGDNARMSRFLTQSHPMLDNRSPIDVAKETIAGADLVLKLLAKADAGVAA